MKIILISILFFLGFGCTAPKPLPKESTPVAASAPKPLPKESTPVVAPDPLVKTCEEQLAEEIAKAKWRKHDLKTPYPGYVENLELSEQLTNELKSCIIGKNREFIVKLLGEPSDSSLNIIWYHCYLPNESDIFKAKCLIFRLRNDSIISVTYEICGYRKL